MTPEQFAAGMAQKVQELRNYVRVELPVKAGNTALRYIDSNFKRQGYMGVRWKDNQRKSRILIKKGHLRNSFHAEPVDGGVRVYSDSPYAKVHNEGFRGTVNVHAYNRTTFSEQKVGSGRYTKTGKERMKTIHVASGSIPVKAHTRNMHMPKRQMMPTGPGDAQELMGQIKDTVIKDLKTMFK